MSKSFFNKIAGPQKCSFIKKTPIQVFSCEIFEILMKGVAYWLATCTLKPKVPDASAAAGYVQR